MVKKVCKDIDDIWLHAYTCRGNKEYKREIDKLIVFEKKSLLIL